MSDTVNKNLYKKQNRIEILDLIRGIAIGLMFIFHLCFGLSELGLLDINFSSDYFWIAFRSLIVFLFLSLVGIGLVLSNLKNTPTKTQNLLQNRLFLLFIYMMLITAFSYYVRPQYYVYFGILHLIFISSIVGRFLIKLKPVFLWLTIIISMSVGLIIESEYLNNPFVYWLGLGNLPPITDDFAPFFPWFSLVVFGIILGGYLKDGFYRNSKLLKWIPINWFMKFICWGGRHSIHIYFIHFQLFYLLVLIFN